MSDAALNDAKQTLTDLEAKHSRLGLNRAGVESKFYSEGALGELNPTLKTVLDILKGISPDSRLQRPEYLGGSSVPVNIAPVAQTSASAISGSATPQGNLSAIGTLLSKSGFTQSFTEHGIIIGLANIRAD